MGRNWTDDEDAILKEMVNQHGKQWALIASKLPGRSASQVAARWEKCLDPNIVKGPFTAEEDQIIVDFVSSNGPRSWPRITALLPHRSPKQCRERWFNHLDPNVTKAPWTAEEDQFIYEQHQLMGAKWSAISKLLPGRTDNAIKNRWNSSISKRLQMDSSGKEILLPDSSHRKHRQGKPAKERFQVPPPLVVPTETSISVDGAQVPGDSTSLDVPKPPPPPLNLPFIDTPSLSPVPGLTTPFSLDGSPFSPTSPLPAFQMTPFGTMQSPFSVQNPFVFSPTKPQSDDTFK